MEIMHLPLEQIRIPAVRITSRMPEDLAEQFRSSVQAAGVIEPLLVVGAGHEYILVNGQHRLQEASARRDATIPCVIIPGTLQDVLLWNLITSGLQGRPPASEVRQVLRVLQDEEGLDLRDLRRRTGLTEDFLSNLLWVNRAIPQVQEALDAEEIPLGAAVILARTDNTELQLRLYEIYLQRRPPLDMFRAIARDAAARLAAAPDGDPAANIVQMPSPRAGPRCDNCGEEVEPRRVQYVCLCPGCMGALWHAARASAVTPPP